MVKTDENGNALTTTFLNTFSSSNPPQDSIVDRLWFSRKLPRTTHFYTNYADEKSQLGEKFVRSKTNRLFKSPADGTTSLMQVVKGIPDHSELHVTFRVAIWGHWDGEGASPKDTFTLEDASDPSATITLLSETFATNPTSNLQSYPSTVAGSPHPAESGSIEQGSLGGKEEFNGVWRRSSVYEITETFQHSKSDLILLFSATNNYWGLESIEVWEGTENVVSRDVTELLAEIGTVTRQTGEQYGVSQGSQVRISFENAPVAKLRSAISTGNTTINIYPLSHFEFQTGDWISISDYEKTEYLQIDTVTANDPSNDPPRDVTLGFANGIAKDYAVADTEIRYAFCHSENFSESEADLRQGFLTLQTSVNNEFVNVWQGSIASSQVAEETVELTCRDAIAELANTALDGRIEFDDRGVATDIEADGNNIGNGTVSSFDADKKELATDLWTMTYHKNSADRWSLTGKENVNAIAPTNVSDDRWEFDQLEEFGFKFTITRGDTSFVDGDKFYFATMAGGTLAVVRKQHGSSAIRYDQNRLSATEVAWETVHLHARKYHYDRFGNKTPLIVESTATDPMQTNVQSTVCRGSFPANTSLLKIIDHGARTSLLDLSVTADNHLKFTLLSPFLETVDLELDHDIDNPQRTTNLLELQSSKNIDDIFNIIEFKYGEKTLKVEDRKSQTLHGHRLMTIRGNDFSTYQLSTDFQPNTATIVATTGRLLRSHADAVTVVRMRTHPIGMLIEAGDLVKIHSRQHQLSNELARVRSVQWDLFTREVWIEAELTKIIAGKYAVVHPPVWQPQTAYEVGDRVKYTSDVSSTYALFYLQCVATGTSSNSYPTSISTPVIDGNVQWEVHALWANSVAGNSVIGGFVGQNDGDERYGFWSDQSKGLDQFGDNNLTISKSGNPDRWGNYSEEHFIIW